MTMTSAEPLPLARRSDRELSEILHSTCAGA
jgi:hypothetical protein